MAAGDFTASQIQEITLREEQIWANPRNRAVYQPRTDTIRSIIGRQTATVSPIEGSNVKDAKIKITWLDVNGLAGTDPINATCDPACPELESADQVDILDIHQEAKCFSVKRFIQTRDNVFDREDMVTKGMLKQKKELDDYLNQTILAETLTYKGANQYPAAQSDGKVTYPVDPTTTNIGPTFWNEDIMPLMEIISDVNYFSNAMFIHGYNLYEIAKVAARLDALNDNEKDRLAKYNLMSHVWDPVTFGTLGLENLSLMIDANAIAFGSKAYHPTSPVSYKADSFLWSTPSMTIPGVDYDVTMTRTCVAVAGVGEEYVETYQMRVHAGLFNNPVHTPGQTGVLEVRKA